LGCWSAMVVVVVVVEWDSGDGAREGETRVGRGFCVVRGRGGAG
jgi:hypothetical protein